MSIGRTAVRPYNPYLAGEETQIARRDRALIA